LYHGGRFFGKPFGREKRKKKHINAEHAESAEVEKKQKKH
jgi:hypothetical protein